MVLLYTPLPLEEILKSETQKKGNYIEIPYSNGSILAELTSSSTAKIVRLTSSNLNDYLHPGLQPGKEIRLKWVNE